EALTNVAKHARATTVQVSVQRNAHAVVGSIRDDGVGFDATTAGRNGRQGLGLTEIRERVAALGGTLRVGPNDGGGGTNLTVEIPLEH
ncbi:MAG TPA: ATP-binding protein, partial [Lysobacter sp.]|nr:ATP-binding protein [Lysobacter sp.]